MPIKLIAIAVLILAQSTAVRGNESVWQAGVARVNITPELPIWLSGYAVRDRPATEKLDELWAKALVLQDGTGKRAVLVTIDLIGLDRDLSLEICRRIEQHHQLPRDAVALSTTHTHSGPIVGRNLAPMYSLDQRETDRIKNYAEELVEKLVSVVGEALQDVQPAQLSWGNGQATFAANRRNNPEGEIPQRREQGSIIGPSDYDVPVLAVHDLSGNLRVVVAGYACHGTVLDDYLISGDWFGTARDEFERRRPGTLAMIWAGCGGDQNPAPRRSIDWLNAHGRAFADAIDQVLSAPLAPIQPSLKLTYEEVALPFAALPARDELEAQQEGDSYEARYARHLLAVWDREGQLPTTYPYPLQVWRLGDEITWVFLGGEVVVDYALRLKAELGPKTTWVTAYANDVMGYIASRRVLAEGGYEGGGSRIYYGLPALWDSRIEEEIITAVHRLAAAAE